MKFLIIRFSSFGDIVLTTPVVRCLKKQLPDLQLHYLTKPAFLPFVSNNPYIDKVHVLDQDWKSMIDLLKQENFDYIIDLHHNIRTFRVKRALKLPSFSFKKLNIRKYIFVKLKWNIMPDVHVVDRYMKTVEPFGVRNDGSGLDYFIARNEEVKQSDIPASHHAGYIAVAIGGSFYTKKLPSYKLQELCAKINHPIILLGGKEDTPAGEEISKTDKVKIYNACGKFLLNESADLVRKSKLLISHDTGLMHVATAFNKKMFVVWGSTVPSFGMGPYYSRNFLQMQQQRPYENVQVQKLWCRPCTKIGRHKCPQGHFKCMKNIDIDELVQKVHTYLSKR
ncbi:MAG: glycosyltransferase family 9 protein [Chitinophagaceae bacterium]|nr:glycosyltransferase family 9 protein [Chitinophagaceae bacterium]